MVFSELEDARSACRVSVTNLATDGPTRTARVLPVMIAIFLVFGLVMILVSPD